MYGDGSWSSSPWRTMSCTLFANNFSADISSLVQDSAILEQLLWSRGVFWVASPFTHFNVIGKSFSASKRPKDKSTNCGERKISFCLLFLSTKGYKGNYVILIFEYTRP
uniref:Uncharacterized protein n=1 Tax=Opuntia streptacantha TaxID=393608 RepID=A0A7C9E710_OPUST